MEINSEYVSCIEYKNRKRLIALKDFSIRSIEGLINVSKGDMGGNISNDSVIIGKSWVNSSSEIISTSIENSYIRSSFVMQGSLSDSIVENSSIKLSEVHTCNIQYSYIMDCSLRSLNAYDSKLSKVNLNRVCVHEFNLYSIGISEKDSLTITKENTIVFKNFWSSGRYFLYHIPTKCWYVGCFTGNSEKLLEKALADDKEKYEMYKKYVDFVQSLIPA